MPAAPTVFEGRGHRKGGLLGGTSPSNRNPENAYILKWHAISKNKRCYKCNILCIPIPNPGQNFDNLNCLKLFNGFYRIIVQY